jgi:glycine cleavage system H lipoate-binding protein
LSRVTGAGRRSGAGEQRREGEGWFFKLRLSDNSELNGLMNADEYKAFCDSQ